MKPGDTIVLTASSKLEMQKGWHGYPKRLAFFLGPMVIASISLHQFSFYYPTGLAENGDDPAGKPFHFPVTAVEPYAKPATKEYVDKAVAATSIDSCPCSMRDLLTFGHKCGRKAAIDKR